MPAVDIADTVEVLDVTLLYENEYDGQRGDPRIAWRHRIACVIADVVELLVDTCLMRHQGLVNVTSGRQAARSGAGLAGSCQ